MWCVTIADGCTEFGLDTTMSRAFGTDVTVESNDEVEAISEQVISMANGIMLVISIVIMFVIMFVISIVVGVCCFKEKCSRFIKVMRLFSRGQLFLASRTASLPGAGVVGPAACCILVVGVVNLAAGVPPGAIILNLYYETEGRPCSSDVSKWMFITGWLVIASAAWGCILNAVQTLKSKGDLEEGPSNPCLARVAMIMSCGSCGASIFGIYWFIYGNMQALTSSGSTASGRQRQRRPPPAPRHAPCGTSRPENSSAQTCCRQQPWQQRGSGSAAAA